MRLRTIENNDSLNMWGYSNTIPNFKFKEKLNKTIECSYGICNSFDTFLSPRDNQSYILYSNRGGTCTNIYIYSTQKKESKKLTPSVHIKELRLLKYFIDKTKKREYIISADCEGILCIWKHNNTNFSLQSKITVFNQIDIYSCLLLFKDDIDFKIEDDYILFGCESVSDDETTSTKVYSLNKGNFIRNIVFTNKEKIRNLLMWNNKKNNENYLLCLAMDKILIINFLKNQKEKEIATKEKNTFNCGIIYNEKIDEQNEQCYLCCTSSTGHILVFDLDKGVITCDIFLKPFIHRVYDILPWNDKYFIVADTIDNGFLVFGYNLGGKIFGISNITGQDEDDIECIKKINHPEYGECLVTASHRGYIKIFEYVSNNYIFNF